MAVIHFLLVYDLEQQRLIEPTREFRDAHAAAVAYAALEATHRGDSDVEIVLVGADSIETIMQTHGHNGISDDGAISGDGSTVSFESDATNLVTGDTNAKSDVFVRTIATGVTIRGSVTNAGAQGNNASSGPSLTFDGKKLGFASLATNLITGDTNSRMDVFIRDLVAGTNTRYSIADSGTAGNGTSQDPWVTADGKTVAFQSVATNLVTGDTNATSDIFVRGPGLDASTYTYDRLYRLTGTVGPDGSPTYAYDPAGNRTSKVLGTATTYSYDRADRITAAGATSITVNANGNTTAKGADTFTYDQPNRLKTATVSGTTETYVYGGDGSRFTRQVGAGTPIRYVSDINRGLPVTIDDGTRKYVYGLGLAYAVSGSTIEVYHTDRLGSVRAITDGTGLVTASYRTDEWGNVTSQSGSSTQPFGFTGEPSDATGLAYLRARYYEPTLGRFVSRDTWAGNPMTCQSLNRYAYVLNNPATRTDPSGLKSRVLETAAAEPTPQPGVAPTPTMAPGPGASRRCQAAQVAAAALVASTEPLVMLQAWLLLSVPATGGIDTPGVAIAHGFILGVEALAFASAGVTWVTNCF